MTEVENLSAITLIRQHLWTFGTSWAYVHTVQQKCSFFPASDMVKCALCNFNGLVLTLEQTLNAKRHSGISWVGPQGFPQWKNLFSAWIGKKTTMNSQAYTGLYINAPFWQTLQSFNLSHSASFPRRMNNACKICGGCIYLSLPLIISVRKTWILSHCNHLLQLGSWVKI